MDSKNCSPGIAGGAIAAAAVAVAAAAAAAAAVRGRSSPRTRATDFSIAAIIGKHARLAAGHASLAYQGQKSAERLVNAHSNSKEDGLEHRIENPASRSASPAGCVSPAAEGSRASEVDIDAEESYLEVSDLTDKSEGDGNSHLRSSEQRKKNSSVSYHRKNSSTSHKTKVNTRTQPRCNCDELLSIDCRLETKELWDKFHELGTEMIITKTGRRMFPTVRVTFSGLGLVQSESASSSVRYVVLLDVVPVDSKRYRYAYHRSSWLVAGKADPPAPSRLYAHPDSPFTAEQLRKQVISFEKVKLTNNEMDKSAQIVLNSMHRYQPRIHLVKRNEGTQGRRVTDLESEQFRTFVYPETVFTAVTAYQNQLITKLKIDRNPFAKGFRDSSRLTDFDCDPMIDNYAADAFPYFRSPLQLVSNAELEASAVAGLFGEKLRAPDLWAPLGNYTALAPLPSGVGVTDLGSGTEVSVAVGGQVPLSLSQLYALHQQQSHRGNNAASLLSSTPPDANTALLAWQSRRAQWWTQWMNMEITSLYPPNASVGLLGSLGLSQNNLNATRPSHGNPALIGASKNLTLALAGPKSPQAASVGRYSPYNAPRCPRSPVLKNAPEPVPRVPRS